MAETYRNVSNSPWTPELQARVAELVAQGLTMQKIGDALGMTKNQIIGWRSRNCYDGPTTNDRLDAMHAKMDAALKIVVMKGSKMLSQKTADELHGLLERAIVTHSHAALGPRVPAPPEFCKVWPQAKPILDGIGPLLGFIPGYGTVAAAALRGLLEVGQHVYDQSCGPKPPAAAE